MLGSLGGLEVYQSDFLEGVHYDSPSNTSNSSLLNQRLSDFDVTHPINTLYHLPPMALVHDVT